LKAKVLHIYTVVLLTLTVFLLVGLIVFEILPITGNDDTSVQRQTDLQLTRSLYLSNAILILAYRPIANHSQAVSDLQTVLPQFQQAQTALLHGDASLGLLGNPPDNVKIALTLADSDYKQMVAAFMHILANSDNPVTDVQQVNIVVAHYRSYVTQMNQVSILVQQNIDTRKLLSLGIRISFIAASVILIAITYFLFMRPMMKRVAEAEAQENAEKSRPPPRDTP
jgi:hypothetical protein